MLTTFRFHVAYDGNLLNGFQSQANGRTVEDELKRALLAITGQNITLTGAGRTDAGVHARGQVVSCAFETRLEPRNLTLALATKLPHDVGVWRIDKMPQGFDARRQSIGKHYLYRLEQSLVPDIYWRNRAWHIKKALDVKAMEEAACFFIGENDFSSFRNSDCQAAHAVRYLWEVSIKKAAPLIEIHIKGNAFCLNMVRIMVGTLVEVGQGKRNVDDIKSILLARDRKMAGVTAKAHGLTLERIYYPDDLDGANIPNRAVFPRFPITPFSWPFASDDIEYGPR